MALRQTTNNYHTIHLLRDKGVCVWSCALVYGNRFPHHDVCLALVKQMWLIQYLIDQLFHS